MLKSDKTYDTLVVIALKWCKC